MILMKFVLNEIVKTFVIMFDRCRPNYMGGCQSLPRTDVPDYSNLGEGEALTKPRREMANLIVCGIP